MRLALAILTIVALARAAHASPVDKQQVRAYVAAGDTDYKLGKFSDALVEYTRAYELFPAPALLFNLGQCHRNLKNYERAAFFYEGFLRESPPNAPNRAVVDDLLREVKAERDKQRAEADANARHQAELAEQTRQLRIESERHRLDEEAKLHVEAERQRLAEQHAQQRADALARKERDREHDRFYRTWWFWSAVGGAAIAIGGSAYYFSGSTTVIAPSGTLGGLDRQ